MSKSRWLLLVLCLLSLLSSNLLARKKLAQTGFQFLSVGTDARATAMGEAYTTFEGNSSALFYNPAGMASSKRMIDLSVNQCEWIADINYIGANLSLNFANGRYGIFGLSFLSVDYGEFLGTIVDPFTDAGFQDTGTFSPGAYLLGIGYAYQISDRFSIGAQIKYVSQSLGDITFPATVSADKVNTENRKYDLGVAAFDFGTLYRTGFKSLVFGMCVRNFSQEIRYEKEQFQLPLTFKIGFSIDATDFVPALKENHALLLTIDAFHPRSYPEYVSFGAEYKFMNFLALRGGYVSDMNDYNFTTGFGIQKFGFAIDYSYTPFDVFDDISRFSVRFSF
ncbi:PorV/PorQ family protein [candidate division KSB1 bacterium]|nr:PorV/PorQ family protein [candidate division KSB1 bacterium]